jgi:hypothetical protein
VITKDQSVSEYECARLPAATCSIFSVPISSIAIVELASCLSFVDLQSYSWYITQFVNGSDTILTSK